MTDFSYTATHGYEFDWSSTPGQCGTSAAALNDPKYSTPRPCKHGNKCYWKGHTRRRMTPDSDDSSDDESYWKGHTSKKDEETGRGCGFVHPGEEGIARRLFPGRTTVSEDGKQTWEPPVVRLVGGATYYERRRLGLSWPEWLEKCEKKKSQEMKKESVLSAAAAPWTPPLPSYSPQAPMLSSWIPFAHIAQGPPGWELMVAQQMITANPALRAVGSACAHDTIADAIRSYKNPSYIPPPSVTSYSYSPITQQVVKKTSTYTAELE